MTSLTPEEVTARDTVALAHGNCVCSEGVVVAALDRLDAENTALDDENLRLRGQAGDMAEEIERLQAKNTALRNAVTRVHGEPLDDIYYQDGLDIWRDQLNQARAERDAALAALTEREVDYQAALAALEALEAVRDAAALRGETL